MLMYKAAHHVSNSSAREYSLLVSLPGNLGDRHAIRNKVLFVRHIKAFLNVYIDD